MGGTEDIWFIRGRRKEGAVVEVDFDFIFEGVVAVVEVGEVGVDRL